MSGSGIVMEVFFEISLSFVPRSDWNAIFGCAILCRIRKQQILAIVLTELLGSDEYEQCQRANAGAAAGEVQSWPSRRFGLI
jgi:hypothetical protein